MEAILVFISKYGKEFPIIYMVIGIAFYILRRKILKRYKKTFFHDNQMLYDNLSSYIKCFLFVALTLTVASGVWFLIPEVIRKH